MTEKNTTPLHGSNVNRSDIPNTYKWHVNDIYADEAAWSEACTAFKKQLPTLKAMHGTLTNAANLAKALKLQDELSQMLEKIYAYARLQQDADNTDQHLQALAGEAEGLAAAFSSANAFLEPEMLALGNEKVETMLQSDPALAEYKFYITNLLRISSHILSADKEALFAESRLALSSSATSFRSLVSADMKFPAIVDGEGKETSVSEGNYLLNMTSADRTLRKNSFCGLMGTYHQYRNTLASTLTGNARAAYFNAKVHNYTDTLEAALNEDNIPTSLYEGLIQTVHDNFAPLHEYMQLKKDVLGYDELHPYDIYMPLAKNAADSFACTFPEACARVEAALAPLGEEYVKTLHKGLTEGWIDTYENKGKRSGAYSWGVYGVHPFVLLNYQPRYNSISTIAHEMGHALHSYYSSQSQTYINADYTIFCAEVASTTNENLLLEHTLKQATDEQKIYLLNQFLEAVRTTVYRQVQFAEFEKFIHSEITAGRSLQAEKLENYWLEINRQYYGPALTVDEELASEWSRIPHFYTPFYVYKYATGYSAATAFSSAILSESQEAVDKYLGFLHAGGSDYSLNILKNAGVNLTTPQPVTVTLQKFANKLQELKALLGK
ncbi:MAG: oligoendopeptidase F [Phascolarctobacterium sp.]